MRTIDLIKGESFMSDVEKYSENTFESIKRINEFGQELLKCGGEEVE